MRRRDVYPCPRRGGGNYRRAPRRISSSICGECATELLAHATPGHPPQGFYLAGLVDIVAALDTDEAREALAVHRDTTAADEARRTTEQERFRPMWRRRAARRAVVDFIGSRAAVPGYDAATCRSVARSVGRGADGGERHTLSCDADGRLSWEVDVEEQVCAYLATLDASRGDEATLALLAADLRAGLHLAAGEPT